MQLSDFDFEIPDSLIAQVPLKERTKSRMMFIDRSSGKIEHRKFLELPSLVEKTDFLVFNQSKVIKARLIGIRPTGGKVEVFLLKDLGEGKFEALLNSSAAKKAGMDISFGECLQGKVVEQVGSSMIYKVQLSSSVKPLIEAINQVGLVPLPPYIKRDAIASDLDRYQTVYAKEEGSVAAPTAGLHFDESVFEEFRSRGISWDYVTLHVGLGTFQPIKSENLEKHKMHSESFVVPEALQARINAMKSSGAGKIVAVGTTALRSLESAARGKSGETDLFLKPGDSFLAVDKLFTNFHQPKSSLIVLLCAFLGSRDLLQEVYRKAVEEKYRFFSYGDCIFIK